MTEQTAPQLAPRDRCTGCAACCNGCPKGAIRMEADREGFLYPQVTDGCVQCGHCTHICPVLKQREPRTEPACFAVWSGDSELRRQSTAGGAFIELARYVLEGGGVVFGAALDEALRVVHIAVKNLHDLPRLQGAKPIQSDMGESYQQVRLYLDQGRQVLFSGTPCQVDGLYRYLGEHPERLLTCDVVCGGVCSPGVWEKLVRSMAYVKQSRPLRVTFSGKLAGDSQRRFRVEFEGGGHYDAPLTKSELGRGITRGLFMRPACHACPYTSTDRPGDVTLGVLKSESLSQEERRLGVSLLLINTAKGVPAGLRAVSVAAAAPEKGGGQAAEGAAAPTLEEGEEMTKTLLHTCCAPCSVACIQMLQSEGIEPVSYWYNPNIHPYQEYKARRT